MTLKHTYETKNTYYTTGVPYHPPLGRFSKLEISTVGIVLVPKGLETSRRELSEDVSFGIGTLL